jgi:hypothetical protein
MVPAGADAAFHEALSSDIGVYEHDRQKIGARPDGSPTGTNADAPYTGPRRTPRKSLIVVLPENHVVSPEAVSAHISDEDGTGQVDVILACAGQPGGLAALQRKIRALQVLLAPAGTSGEDLRELAMSQAGGDIITLLSGTRLEHDG